MHIGNRIKEILGEKGRTAIWLASQIPCERSTCIIYSGARTSMSNCFAAYRQYWGIIFSWNFQKRCRTNLTARNDRKDG